jgi:cell volume regulation protein A
LKKLLHLQVKISFLSLSIENILLIGSILLIISIILGKTSFRFGVPTLVFFLAVGMLAGAEGPGKIVFDNSIVAQFIGVVALNVILFSGGLDTSYKAIRPVLGQGVILATLGVALTAIITGYFIHFAFGFSLFEGMLIGSIVSSTDAAAVFSILRSRNIALKDNLRPLLEFESGSNDPMAFFLTISFTALVTDPSASVLRIFPKFLMMFSLGVGFGFGFGYLGKLVINKIKLGFEGLYPVLAIAWMFLTYSVTDYFWGNGFLAVYICGIYLGNVSIMHKKAIVKSFDGFAWLMQIILFLTLGLLVNPSGIIPIIGVGLLISLFLMLVSRPVSVFISLIIYKMKFKNKVFVSLVGLRGAVPIVFAIYPMLAGVEHSQTIFNIVFFISLSSVLIQGSGIGIFAKWLKVAMPAKVKRKSIIERLLDEEAKSEIAEITIGETSPHIGKTIVELNFPETAIIAMIQRGEKYVIPKGNTEIKEGDIFVILSENIENIETLEHCLNTLI